MNNFFEKLKYFAQNTPSNMALKGIDKQDTGTSYRYWTYAELLNAIEQLSHQLTAASIQHIGLMLDNNPQWVIVQLAAFLSSIPITPIPAFFSAAQKCHVLTQTGLDCLFASNDQSARDLDNAFQHHETIPDAFYRAKRPTELPQNTALITFTSGTTNHPKGVCLSLSHIFTLCERLSLEIQTLNLNQHLCLMPLAILLENIAGMLVPLFMGKTVILLPPHRLGLIGSSQINLPALAETINREQPDSIIATPALFKGLIHAKAHNALVHRPKFIAVGGGRVGQHLLERAKALDLPVFEGYGLSECGSVVSVNVPKQYRAGSVGKPLSGTAVAISNDGEIMVQGLQFLGYLGEPPKKHCNIVNQHHNMVATGDLGYVDKDGFLYIYGRKKNHIINSFGRNIAPEWLEAELCAHPYIQQACIVGDNEPFLTALITPLGEQFYQQISQVIDSLNSNLPDYARIHFWTYTQHPFSVVNNQLTPNGRLKRDAISQAYQDELKHIYQTSAAQYLAHAPPPH